MNKIYEDRNWLSDSVYFLKYSWIIIVMTIIGIVFSIIVIFETPSVYRAQSTYYLNKSDINSSFFTINEFQFYNLLLLDVKEMIHSYKFYEQVAVINGDYLLSYGDYLEGLYVAISTESTFFVVGFDDSDKVLAATITKKIEEVIPAQASTVVRISNIDLVDSMVLLEEAIAPNKELFVAGGIVCGLFSGIGIVMLMYLLTNKIRTSNEVVSITKLKVLSQVKISDLSHRNLKRILKKKHVSDYYLAQQTIIFEHRTNKQKVFLFINNDEGGKNEAYALKLGQQMARKELKTLYFSINPSKPFGKAITQFGKEKNGLKQILGKISKLDEVTKKIDENLYIIPSAGEKLSFKQEYLEQFEVFMDSLEAIYDIVLISVRLDEQYIYSLVQRGKVIDSISDRSNREIVKSNIICLKLYEADVLGAVYQE